MVGYVGAGSNLGDREANLRAGLSAMARRGIKLLDVSSLWETEPVLSPEPLWFLNLVVRIETALPPLELLGTLLDVEKSMGRTRTAPNAPRILDLDLLLLGDIALAGPQLTLPHPRMWGRRFVLAPLVELAPKRVNPATGRTVVEELEALSDAFHVRRVGSIALPQDEPL